MKVDAFRRFERRWLFGAIGVVLAYCGLIGIGSGLRRTEIAMVEYVNYCVLLAVLAACAVYYRNRLRGENGKLFLALIVVCSVALVSPVFILSRSSDAVRWTDILWPLLMWWGIGVAGNPDRWRQSKSRGVIEQFLRARGFSRNLAVSSFLVTAAGSLLAGASVSVACARALVLALGAWMLTPLFLAMRSPGATFFAFLVVFLLLAGSIVRAESQRQYVWRVLNHSREMLAAGQFTAAKSELNRALDANKTLRNSAFELEAELELAKYHESKSQYEESTVHWERVADLQKIDRAEFLPLQRVLCERGDSLSAWRRLVFKGFSSLNNPEIEPGIKRLAEISPDVRAKLLAALLAWDQNAPEAERRKKLEDVQKVSPNEPTSRMLLQRMGVTTPQGPLWMPPELLVAPKSIHWTVPGSLEDSGSVGSLVVLEPGKWEMTLRMQATPLNEEWPIIRVELNGKPLGSTQVAKSEPHLIPFTFEVNKGDIYRVKVVFENQRDELEGGRMRRRGLNLHGIQFSQSSR